MPPPGTPYAWLKADAGTFQDTALTTPATTDGTVVEGWADQSASGFNATNTLGPTLKLNIQNTLPVLRFDGTDDILFWNGIASQFDGRASFTTFFAGGNIASATNGVVLSMETASSSSDYSYFRVRSSDTTPPCQEYGRATGANIRQDKVDVGTGFFIAAVVCDGTTMTVYTNADAGVGSNINTNPGTYNQATIGGLAVASHPTGLDFYPADIGELLIYSSALSTPNLALAWSYLAARWGTSTPPVIPVGTLIFTGLSFAQVGVSSQSLGTLTFTGLCLINSITAIIQPTGTLTFTGLAAEQTSGLYSAVGSVLLSGLATGAVSGLYGAVGAVVWSGLASSSVGFAVQPLGGMRLAGIASPTISGSYLPYGSLSLNGAAGGAVSGLYAAVGGCSLSGLASASVHSAVVAVVGDFPVWLVPPRPRVWTLAALPNVWTLVSR